MEARAARAPLRAVPEGPSEGSAYRQVASDLRQAIAAGRYPAGQRLPTEAELVASTGLGRQTVRRAFQELVTEGVIYRVRGRGTFAVPGDGKYLRSFGSIDDLMALSLDTELQVVEPLHVLASVEVAGQLRVGAGVGARTGVLIDISVMRQIGVSPRHDRILIRQLGPGRHPLLPLGGLCELAGRRRWAPPSTFGAQWTGGDPES